MSTIAATPAEDSATMNLNGSRTEYRVGFSGQSTPSFPAKDLETARRFALQLARWGTGRTVEILLVTVTPIVITDMTLRSAG